MEGNPADEVVPRNARFLVHLEVGGPMQNEPVSRIPVSEIRWSEKETDAAVAFDATPAGDDPTIVWLVPTELLEPATEYVIRIGPKDDSTFFAQFKTSELVDESAPSADAPQIEEEHSGSCGASMSAALVWKSIHDNDVTMIYDPVVKLVVQDGQKRAVLFTDALRYKGRRVTLPSPLDSSSSECWGKYGLPFEDSRALKVTATIFDRAGNATELAPVNVELSRDDGAECPSDEGDCALSPSAVGAPARTTPVLVGALIALACLRLCGAKRRCASWARRGARKTPRG